MNNTNVSDISVTEVLQFIYELVQEKSKSAAKEKKNNLVKPLNNSQTAIFTELWLDDSITYREIAERIKLSNEGVRSAAKGMYAILNEIMPTYTKIERKNLKSSIAQCIAVRSIPPSQKIHSIRD